MDAEGPPEHEESLWVLIVGPTIWAVHFLLCYLTAAIWCAKVAGTTDSVSGARIAISIYTVVALIGIGIAMIDAYRRHEFGEATLPHDYATAADRHRFLGFAAFLLSGLSFISTLFVGIVVYFIDKCG